MTDEELELIRERIKRFGVSETYGNLQDHRRVLLLEVDRVKKIIKEAPHASGCPILHNPDKSCYCWKSNR